MSQSLQNSKAPVDIKHVEYTIGFDNRQPIPIVHIIGRTRGGTRVELTYDKQRSYFYVPSDEFENEMENQDEVLRVERGYESIYGDTLVKVYTRIPPEVPRLRDDYEHYEADIPFPLRFMIDNGITDGMMIPESYIDGKTGSLPMDLCEPSTVNIESRVCFCDIEVDDKGGFPDPEDGEKEIISITVYDNYLERYEVFLYHPELPIIESDEARIRVWDDEREMMKAFIEYLNTTKPDFLTGWNFEHFDARYLYNRLETLFGGDDEPEGNDLSPLGNVRASGWGVDYKGLEVFDMLEAYKRMKFSELDSYSLEDVTQEELGEGKIKDERTFHEQWMNDPQQLIDYNIRDVELLVRLEQAEGIIKFYEEMSDFVGWTASNVTRSASSVDCYILRKSHGKYVLPSKASSKSEAFEGATVFDPSSGLKSNVIVLDLKSLYPMTIKTINAGPETKKEDGHFRAPNGVRFQKEPRSIVAEMIDELLERREQKKAERDSYPADSKKYEVLDRQQTAVKIVMNTIYGVMGSDTSRVGDKDTGAAVTAAARGVIAHTKETAEEQGFDVIYGDTDSVMIELGDEYTRNECLEIGNELEVIINEAYSEFAKEELNADEHWFQVEFEKLYEKFLQAGKKKRYAGKITWKEGKDTEYIDITGFEYQRSDYCEVAKEIQKSVFDIILNEGTLEELSEYVNTEIDKIKSGEYNLDNVGIPGKYSGPPDDYDAPTIHSRGSHYTNQHLDEEITIGSRPKGMYVDKIMSNGEGDSPPWPREWNNKTPFICWMNPKMVPDEIVMDWDQLIDKQIKGPIQRLLQGTPWSWAEVKTGVRQRGIGEFDAQRVDDANEVTFSEEPDEYEDDFEVDSIDDVDKPVRELNEMQNVLGSFENNGSDETEVVATMTKEDDDDSNPDLDSYL